MATVVVWDPADPQVANRVVKFLPSGHTPAHQGNPNTLVNGDLGLLWDAANQTYLVPLKHWKYDGVGDIVEMTQPEKDIIDKVFEESKMENSDGETGTGETAWQEKLSMTFDCKAGTYKLTYSAEVSSGGNKAAVNVRVQCDDTDTVAETSQFPDAATFQGWGTVSGFVDVVLTEALHTFDIDFSSNVQDSVVKVRRARLEIH